MILGHNQGSNKVEKDTLREKALNKEAIYVKMPAETHINCRD
jgi:hypothetical protein